MWDLGLRLDISKKVERRNLSQRVAVSPLGGCLYRPVEVANPFAKRLREEKGGHERCSVWRRVSTRILGKT
jgi:hypothetical protein